VISPVQRVAERLTARGLSLPRQLRRALPALAAASPAAQARILGALATVLPGLAPLLPPPPDCLCPAYPQASPQAQARLALGDRPEQVLRGLTRREAHEALRDGYDDASAWLLRDVPVAAGRRAPSVPVARWILACHRDPTRWAALETERTEQGPGGVEIRGRLLDRVDEIRAADLDGEHTSVRRAFESAARRAYAQWERDAETQHEALAPLPAWWRPIRCARALTSAAELVAEGRALNHCVGTYSAAVRARKSWILSIRVRVGSEVYASTAELDYRSGGVLQHKGRGNTEPPLLCQRALDVIERRLEPRKE
jgi:hypothetical protein